MSFLRILFKYLTILKVTFLFFLVKNKGFDNRKLTDDVFMGYFPINKSIFEPCLIVYY